MIVPVHGVVTLFGYGSVARVERGHLILEDGVGMKRGQGRFAGSGAGLKRLVVIGSSGMVTFEALRWLSEQDAAFVMLDRDGSVLAVSGPVGPSDARLRRAQSLAHPPVSLYGLQGSSSRRSLRVRKGLLVTFCGTWRSLKTIASFRGSLESAKSTQDIRQNSNRRPLKHTGLCGATFRSNFPTADLNRVPQHWRTFGTRKSPISGSPRLAVNPSNSTLNFFVRLARLRGKARRRCSRT